VVYLLDTSLLVRLANSADAQHSTAVTAVLELHRRGEALHVTPQVLVEFRSVATRPVESNGLGLSPADAAAQSAGFEAAFGLLVETLDVYPAWKQVVDGLGIIGKQVHDARLVAVCHVHGVSHLLTFNAAHFARMAEFGPTVVMVEPKSI
jgi:predicted nucleic acid-binding protein